MPRIKTFLVGVPITIMMVLVFFPAVAGAATLSNGFTAAVVATSGQRITGSVSASGYDVGIYIGPGVHDVKVNGANVSGANDQGILVQDASSVVIENSTIEDNAIAVYTGLTEAKGIVLAGSRNCLVRNNTLTGNGDGGISVLDDGSRLIFAPTPVTTSPTAGTGNVITGNLIQDNLGGCGIVLSAKNPGGGVSHNVVSSNTVLGFNPAAGDFLPGVGGIIVAGGVYGPVNLEDNVILNNVVTGGFVPGISLHAFGPGVITGTKLIGNKLTNNGGAGDGLSNDSTGMEIFAVPGVGTISGTQVLTDTVSNDTYGVWHVGDVGTHTAHLMTNGVAFPVAP